MHSPAYSVIQQDELATHESIYWLGRKDTRFSFARMVPVVAFVMSLAVNIVLLLRLQWPLECNESEIPSKFGESFCRDSHVLMKACYRGIDRQFSKLTS